MRSIERRQGANLAFNLRFLGARGRREGERHCQHCSHLIGVTTGDSGAAVTTRKYRHPKLLFHVAPDTFVTIPDLPSDVFCDFQAICDALRNGCVLAFIRNVEKFADFFHVGWDTVQRRNMRTYFFLPRIDFLPLVLFDFCQLRFMFVEPPSFAIAIATKRFRP